MAGEELGDGAPGPQLDDVIGIDELKAEALRKQRPTVLLPEPMKPVSTMRWGGAD